MHDPYGRKMFKENPYYAKSDIQGQLVVVLRGMYEDRGLELIKPPSRCVKKYEIHELICSDETGIAPGSKVDKIAYIGFAEILQGGVITVGDGVFCGENQIGFVAGFDETHSPNHLNIVIRCDKRLDGEALGLRPAGKITFKQTK